MNEKKTSFSFIYFILQKRTKNSQQIERLNLLFPFRSFSLYISIYCIQVQNKGESNSQPVNTHSTNASAPACITYSQPPPSSGSLVDEGFSPTIFSYSCGPTQTTHVYLATATNAPASASPSPSANSHTPISITHLPIAAYVGIGIGGVILLLILDYVRRACRRPRVPSRPTTSQYQLTTSPYQPTTLPYQPTILPYQPTTSPYQPPATPYRRPTSPYQCRYCDSTDLDRDVVRPGNPIGNVGRPYYVCANPDCPKVTNPGQHIRGWVTWDDNIGVDPRNPPCDCGRSTREDTARAGHRFWTCSRGRCDFYRRVPGT